MVRLDRTICISMTVRVMVQSSRTMTGTGESTSTRTGIREMTLARSRRVTDLVSFPERGFVAGKTTCDLNFNFTTRP